MSNIAQLLQFQARRYPDAPAIIDQHNGQARITTFDCLENQVARAATLLWDSGLRPGSAVLVFLPMSAELYVALIALFRIGAIAMFVDPSSGLRHIEECCMLRAPDAFIGGVKGYLLAALSPALRRIPRKFSVGFSSPWLHPWGGAARCSPRTELWDSGSDHPALLTFSSGSTGTPKAALRTHGFLSEQQRVLEHTFPGKPGEVSLTTLPIFVLSDLASGVTSLIAAGNLRNPGAIDPNPILEQIRRFRPVRACASPAFWERLAGGTCSPGDLQSLRFIYAGGAPVFPRLQSTLAGLAPEAEVIAVYGSSEAEPIAHVSWSQVGPEDLDAILNGKGLLAGFPVPDIQVRILPDRFGTPRYPSSHAAFQDEWVGAGEAGEIVVSGHHVLAGYGDGRGDAETKFRVEGQIWHRTGDAGSLDQLGRLWLLGRCVARISRGTLYPLMVESAVSGFPSIRRSAVVSWQGERILAIEWTTPGLPHQDLEAIRSSVSWAGLDRIEVYRAIPVDKRHHAKVNYPELWRLLEHHPDKAGQSLRLKQKDPTSYNRRPMARW